MTLSHDSTQSDSGQFSLSVVQFHPFSVNHEN